MSSHTPWGASQHSTPYGLGITFHSTASHGGFEVEATLNGSMPDVLRREDGWYEEDCDAARVIVAFPDRFTAQEVQSAQNSLRTWHPDGYEAHFGVTILAGASFVKDERAFLAAHKEDYIVVAAYGDWHKDVPAGMVGLQARKGGRSAGGQEHFKNFLVADELYKQRGRHGFIVDLQRDTEVPDSF